MLNYTIPEAHSHSNKALDCCQKLPVLTLTM